MFLSADSREKSYAHGLSNAKTLVSDSKFLVDSWRCILHLHFFSSPSFCISAMHTFHIHCSSFTDH